MVATPQRKEASQLCHVNLLKPYYACPSIPSSIASDLPIPAGVTKPVLLTSSGPELLLGPSVSPTVAVCCDGGLLSPDDGVLEGRLNNSESLGGYSAGILVCSLSCRAGSFDHEFYYFIYRHAFSYLFGKS